MPDAPAWVGTGVMDRAAVSSSDSRRTRRPPGTQHLAILIRDNIASISGRGLAFLDFLTFNGVSAIKTYFETHDPYLVVCATFLGQLAQLYYDSFDPNISSDQRARYLGQLLTIAVVTGVLAGHDQFDLKFQTALKDAGLFDAWPEMKPLIGDIGTTVSTKAAALMLSVVEKVARHFSSI
jgi:hypothetical protein